MKIRRLQIQGYKNIHSCDVEFVHSPFINAVIGGNGSGKSNLIEAILSILIGCYFQKPPPFDFQLEFEVQNRLVKLQRESRSSSVSVDGKHMSLDVFAEHLRGDAVEKYYPDLTLVYYSGECERVRRLIARYWRHFQKLTRKPETDGYRPLFVQSGNQQSQVILLALFAHGYRELLDYLELKEIIEVSIILRSPDGFDPKRHEPKLWNTEGAIRRIVSALDETATSQERLGIPEEIDIVPAVEPLNVPARRHAYKEERLYRFREDRQGGIRELAKRLSAGGDNIYLALESLRARGIFRSVSFRLTGRSVDVPFSFDQLSEGEKQLLAVVGALRLTHQKDNLVLLDEPDTHLNPHWSWDFPSLLTEALRPEQRTRSTILMATHDPVMISGMVREQILLAHAPTTGQTQFYRPHRNPRGQGVANILCSSEFFGLPSSLDKETQKLLDERLKISIQEKLSAEDKARLKELNNQLEILPGTSERDPEYVAFLRQKYAHTVT